MEPESSLPCSQEHTTGPYPELNQPSPYHPILSLLRSILILSTNLCLRHDVNLLGDNIDTIKKNTQTLIDASKEVGLEVNTEKLSICCSIVIRMEGK
jgi:hypothetical protein